MDGMASYNDYGFFPYLVDTLSSYLRDCPYLSEEGKSAFLEYDEEWKEYCIGEEVAMIWFNKAAAVGHHLAIKRLTTNENETQY